MQVHLIDGTYELFRAHFGAPSATAPDGREVGATRGFARSLLSLLREPTTTHVACAFDHTVESFRNSLFEGYKTGEGLDPTLFAQFPLVEQAAAALGVVVWPMVEFEADDALATAATRLAAEAEVERVLIGTPDKDLAQCVQGTRVVCLDRRRKKVMDETGVWERFGVAPRSIPDYLALVGDTADGIPGIPRWGARSSATVLAQYPTLEEIPEDPTHWRVKVRGATSLAKQLNENRDSATLYRKLATLRLDVPLRECLDDLRWRDADRAALEQFCALSGESALLERVPLWRPELPADRAAH